jgi:pimeloyl-ACP methyl ester carboxylesterase
MSGINSNWNPPVTLHLKQVVKMKPNFSIKEVQIKKKDITLSGSLFLPNTAEPYPSIIIVHGSGSGRRSIFWGRFFVNFGIATLIFDRRGEGQSTGNLEIATYHDLADDVLACVEYLKSRKEIDDKKIGIYGSSQGGWLAPLAASKSDDVAYLILNVAPAVSVSKQETDRVVYTLRQKGYSEKVIATAKEYTEKMFQVSYNKRSISELKPLIDKIKNEKWAGVLTLVESEDDLEDWRMEKFDPKSVLKKTRIPVLVIYGEKDVLVPPEENKKLMEEYLTAAGNTDFTIQVIPDIGHNMFVGQKLRGNEWNWPQSYWQWDKKSPILLKSIKNWVLKHLNQ